VTAAEEIRLYPVAEADAITAGLVVSVPASFHPLLTDDVFGRLSQYLCLYP
jgi:hypothetical protein